MNQQGQAKTTERNAATGRFTAKVQPASACGFCDVCDGPTEDGVCVRDRDHTDRVKS